MDIKKYSNRITNDEVMITAIVQMMLLSKIIMQGDNDDNGITEIQKQSQEVFYIKKGVYKNFTKFTGKYLCQSLFFNKVATLC